MPPTQRARSKRTTTTVVLPTNGSHPTKTYKLEQYRTEAGVEPFVLETDDDRIVIDPPTGETLLTIGETPVVDTRKLLNLLCGDQAEAVWAAVRHEPAGVLVGLLQDLGQHFMVMNVTAAPGGSDASPS